jgi:hypothetical protein
MVKVFFFVFVSDKRAAERKLWRTPVWSTIHQAYDKVESRASLWSWVPIKLHRHPWFHGCACHSQVSSLGGAVSRWWT